MGELKIKLTDDIERKFRAIAMQRYKFHKGALSQAAAEALQNWTEQYESLSEEITKNPIEALEGIMGHIKNKTSVQLQHEAWSSIGKKHVNRR